MVDEIRKRPKPRSGLYYCRFDGEIDTLLTVVANNNYVTTLDNILVNVVAKLFSSTLATVLDIVQSGL